MTSRESICGAAIEIGTAKFIDPTVTIKVIDGINDYLDQNGFKSVQKRKLLA